MGWMVLSVGLGGAFGAICRYLISLWVTGSFAQAGWRTLPVIVCLSVAGFYVVLMVVRLIAGQG